MNVIILHRFEYKYIATWYSNRNIHSTLMNSRLQMLNNSFPQFTPQFSLTRNGPVNLLMLAMGLNDVFISAKAFSWRLNLPSDNFSDPSILQLQIFMAPCPRM